ncbi:DnaJ domain-containing protein [Sphaerisporangium fuscum]|uniref:DnaJ domain-containing protein n=1 Tax=Sphaerisporangium fuscum TaxID=2835868 RepID=UPI001BDC9174|nr:DnaJ domain-containing protein [Sphaerisporangium fuscum]
MNERFRDLDGRDAYELLGVSQESSDDAIRTAFRKQAAKWHPDKNLDADSEKNMRLLNAAKDALLNNRVECDNFRAGDIEPEEIFLNDP